MNGNCPSGSLPAIPTPNSVLLPHPQPLQASETHILENRLRVKEKGEENMLRVREGSLR